MYLRSTYVKNTKKFSMKIIIQLGRYISSQIVAEFAYPPQNLHMQLGVCQARIA